LSWAIAAGALGNVQRNAPDRASPLISQQETFVDREQSDRIPRRKDQCLGLLECSELLEISHEDRMPMSELVTGIIRMREGSKSTGNGPSG
jgi:hypothetical protein